MFDDNIKTQLQHAHYVNYYRQLMFSVNAIMLFECDILDASIK